MIRVINKFNLKDEVKRLDKLLNQSSTIEDLRKLIEETSHINTIIRIRDFSMKISGRDLIVTFIDDDTDYKFKMLFDQSLWYLEQIRPYQHIAEGTIEEESGYEKFTIKNIKEFLLEEGIIIKIMD